MNHHREVEVIAVGKAHYRGYQILETPEGCCFIHKGKQYDCNDLEEATAAIDAIYIDAAWQVTAIQKTNRSQPVE